MHTARMNCAIFLLLSIAGFGQIPAKAFSLSFDIASSSSRAHTRPHALVGFAPDMKTSPLAFFKRDVSSSRQLSSSSDSNEGKDEPWIRPAIHNSPLFRASVILYALLFAIYQTSNSPTASGATMLQKMGKRFVLAPKAAATLHLLSFGTWFGTVVYTTFIAGITMFKNLPRRTFGTLQSKLFPLYFQLCTGMIGVQILTLIRMPDIISKSSELSLGIAFFSTLVNLLFLEPASTENMFGRYALEDDGKKDTEKYKQLAKAFGKFHGMSSLLNLVALCGGIVHGVCLASNLIV
ncbi:hypothetical protein ACHAW6_005477 [Cyclotella cf. meneghiniana]